MNIKSLKIIDLNLHSDDRGDLFEVLHSYDIEKFGQIYIVHNRTKGIIRAFHKHHQLWDYFCIIHGSAKFVFEKDGQIDTVVLTARKPQLIIVPPETYHGWMSLEDDTILMSATSELYNKDNPDEERISYESFGKVWDIIIK